MAVTYSLGENPIWYFADNDGKPLSGGYLRTLSNLDPTALKPIYTDSGGQFPWAYVAIPHNTGKTGILFDATGSQGPFWFSSDSTFPNDIYFLEVYNSTGQLIRTISDYSAGGGSGGGVVSSGIDLENLIVNNVMWRNIGSTPVAPSTFLKVAPGPHASLINNAVNPTGFYTGPDICFIKNNTSATDTISFPLFTPFGQSQLTNDTTPVDYCSYNCTAGGSGETIKAVQFPITKGVANLSNNPVTVSIWARCNAGNNLLSLQWLQFFGDGSGSAPITTAISTMTLNSSWQRFTFTVTVPSVFGQTTGSCGNDALFLQVLYPLNAATQIDFTKLSMYMGSVAPSYDFHTYDMIDGVINAQRTGYIMSGFDTIPPLGYLRLDDNTIGNPTSGANSNGGLGANINVFGLYNLLWNNVSTPSANTLCPVSGGLGASAVADFTAGKRLTLASSLGRALGASGAGSGLTSRALGSFVGEETHVLTIPEMPSHDHQPQNLTSFVTNVNGTPGVNSGSITSPLNQTVALTSSTGGGLAHNNMQPSAFMNFFIKL